MYIGMNNYSLYDPLYCDGRFCCRDCDRCKVAEQIMEDMGEDDEQAVNDSEHHPDDR